MSYRQPSGRRNSDRRCISHISHQIWQELHNHAIWKTTVLAQLERPCQQLGCFERVAKLDVMIWLHQRSSEGGSVYLLVVLCITKSGLIYPLTDISMMVIRIVERYIDV